MNTFCRIGACIIITGMELGVVLDEPRHKHIEQRHYETQAELTKEPAYSTASITYVQLFSALFRVYR
jgi:hypothetical protein